MMAEEDKRRLLEARHDVEAVENAEKLAKLTGREPQRAALSDSRDQLAQARAGLAQGLEAQTNDSEETSTAQTSYAQARTRMLGRYDHLRKKVDERLLNRAPDEPFDPEELKRLLAVFDRYFWWSRSDLEGLGVDKLAETLEPTVVALATQADLAPLGLRETAARDLEALKAAKAVLQREWSDDAEAMDQVRRARAELDRAQRSHALLVESLLVREGRPAELGRFIRAADPAYAARRRAGVSVDEEPKNETEPTV